MLDPCSIRIAERRNINKLSRQVLFTTTYEADEPQTTGDSEEVERRRPAIEVVEQKTRNRVRTNVADLSCTKFMTLINKP